MGNKSLRYYSEVIIPMRGIRLKVCIIFLLCLIMSYVFYGCNVEKTQTIDNTIIEEVYLINIEEISNNEVSLKLSDIADTIEYMELKVNANTVIFAQNKYDSKKYYFITSHEKVYQFTLDFKYIRQIGRRGQGPGEYAGLGNLLIDDENEKVGLLDIQTSIIHFYSTKDGSFLYSHTLPRGIKTEIFYKDSLFYISAYPNNRTKNILTILNQQNDTLGYIPNYNYLPTEGSYGYMSFGGSSFHTYDGRLFFRGFNDNDTIWELKGAEHKVYAVVDKGKFKSPEYEWEEMKKRAKNNEGNYYQIRVIKEDEHYLYVFLAPHWNRNMRIPYIIYDKKEKKGFSSFSVENDISGGVFILPFSITDNYYMSFIEAHHLLEYEKINNRASTSYKNFLNTINEDSNTILIRAKQKHK